jgi:hypothetical protein
MTKPLPTPWIPALVVLAVAPWALAQDGEDIELISATVNGGGWTWSTGGDFLLGGTIGQPGAAAQPCTGGDYELVGGFWSALATDLVCLSYAAVDFDRDCDVDNNDLSAFVGCATGPMIPVQPDCAAANVDGDSDVDQDDFGVFQRCYSGAGKLAAPDCGN